MYLQNRISSKLKTPVHIARFLELAEPGELTDGTVGELEMWRTAPGMQANPKPALDPLPATCLTVE